MSTYKLTDYITPVVVGEKAAVIGAEKKAAQAIDYVLLNVLQSKKNWS